MVDADANIRLDKWLWAARFFKTRALASAAISNGKVLSDGQRLKPARQVKIAECYQIQRSQERFEVIVCGLSEHRGSAPIAQTLYQETDASQERRRLETEQRKLAAMARPSSDHRPNKQERRKIRQFNGKV